MTATLLARFPGAAPTLPPEVDRRTGGHARLAVRRLLAVLGTAVCLVLVTGIPAWAAFADTAGLAVPMGTTTIAAPGNVVGNLVCSPTDSTMSVAWTASTSSHVSGYRVRVHFSDGRQQHAVVGAAATSWSAPITTYDATAYSIKFTVTTVTTYDWEKESVETGSFRC